MSQSLHQLYAHIIFSTKHRKPFLSDQEQRFKLHAYITGILNKLECYSIIVGGVEDHVHIGCALTKKYASPKVLEFVKKDSSKWLKTLSPTFRNFHWQDGYGLFSVCSSHFDLLKQYITNQVEHHRTETFQEEFIKLCKKNGVSFDERYLWD
jgi:REP element-mobilizing transposase RayT